ncbi:T9SS type A sorting domain-containing protein [Bacteroidota bacterium]
MMMNTKLGILIFCFSLGSISVLDAQEVLLPAGLPASLASRAKKSTMIDIPPDTLELPFFDDFSRRGWLPYREFWTDRYVVINNSYTRNPVTIGIATLDAVFSDGSLNGTTKLPFESDFLTSVPINLDYPGRKDIWLSFFYEPMGLGDVPEPFDSLTVEFLAPDSSTWETVWADTGSYVDTFKQVFIPIQQSRFLKKGFQFRFKNYASLPLVPGKNDYNNNADHWNIDYVYLDSARSSNVTALNDVSMIASLGSLLKNYQAIPWRHFKRARLTELNSTVDISYRNNDTTIRNVTRILKITDLLYPYSDSVNGGAANVVPGELSTFKFPYNYPFPTIEPDSMIFEVKSYLVTEDLDYKWNDTVVHHQIFHNYYAYDDGSAENGYGLRGEGTANAAVAYEFNTFLTDTLRAVQMYFNRTLGDYSQDFFRLGVWKYDQDQDGPGELIHAMAGVKPEYIDELNKFYTYVLDTTIVVSGTFYVGWIKTTESMLNVGWDVWNNERDKIYYNLGQGWVNTGFNGCLMVRPVMGKELSWPVVKKEIPEIQMQVYPNPANDRFYLEISRDGSAGEWKLSLYNLHGKLVYESPAARHSHYIGHLTEGFYIIRLSQRGIFKASSKLMIVR